MFVVLLALIATSIAPAPALPAAISIAPQLGNLIQEYRYAAGLSNLDKTDRLNELSAYFRDNVYGFDAIYALITVAPGTYDLAIGNFLYNPIEISVSATNSNPATASGTLPDRGSGSWSFAASGSIQLTINYVLRNATYTKPLYFAADGDRLIGWFDIGINADRSMLRKSDVWTVTG